MRAMRCMISAWLTTLLFEFSFTVTSSLVAVSPAASRDIGSCSLILTRIEGIAQPIADKCESEHRQSDRQGGEEPQVPVDANVLCAIGHHLAQARRWLVD